MSTDALERPNSVALDAIAAITGQTLDSTYEMFDALRGAADGSTVAEDA